ncbi:FxsA family protein [Saccharopolyspora oryzae]|uniref:FxsA family protein n=1 Tax=Saccharopolyspora oryzae TaxID=2997343 RepID=A0ABT4VAX9_9PSEU|nr:FxsA family protein [Saccharopolyspora oryzae]MDA3631115.1 FxsA family protein [Saccharopolyspora oryzae]
MPIFVVLLIAVAAEIAVLVALGQVIGVLPTLGLLVAGAVLGAWLLRREGRRTMVEFREAARLRRSPDREISDGVLIAASGLLIILPGLLSDVAGLLLLFPPIRAVLRKRMLRAAERRSKQMQDQVWLHTQRVRRERGSAGSDVIDGEVVSVTEDDEPTADAGPKLLPPQRSAQAERSDEQPRS